MNFSGELLTLRPLYKMFPVWLLSLCLSQRSCEVQTCCLTHDLKFASFPALALNIFPTQRLQTWRSSKGHWMQIAPLVQMLNFRRPAVDISRLSVGDKSADFSKYKSRMWTGNGSHEQDQSTIKVAPNDELLVNVHKAIQRTFFDFFIHGFSNKKFLSWPKLVVTRSTSKLRRTYLYSSCVKIVEPASFFPDFFEERVNF